MMCGEERISLARLQLLLSLQSKEKEKLANYNPSSAPLWLWHQVVNLDQTPPCHTKGMGPIMSGGVHGHNLGSARMATAG